MVTQGHVSEPARAGIRLRRCVLVAVEPPSLQRLIQHVLDGDRGLRVVTAPPPFPPRLAPDVIVTNQRLQRQRPGDLVAELKRSCPASTLILLTPTFAGPVPDHHGADICLPEEAIVQALLPMIRQLTLRAADRTPSPASAGPRT